MAQNIYAQKILILDFGSQVTQLIARRIREIGVYCELWPWDVTEDQIKQFAPDGIILSGGPESVTENDSPRAPQYVFEAGVPVLGICYGFQVMAHELGGQVDRAALGEYGKTEAVIEESAEILAGSAETQDVWMSHGVAVNKAPEGFKVLARTAGAPVAAMADSNRRLYGIQWHPEASSCGEKIIRTFLEEVSKRKKQETVRAGERK